MTNIFAWSKVALSNQNADSGINFLEGTQLPSTVNDSCRQLMARVAELLEDLSAANATGGAANAQTVTLDSGFTALGAFKVCVITATLAVTGAATLDTNSIGAKPWRKITAAGEVELEAGDVNVNSRCANIYSSTAGGGSGAWILLNPGTAAISPLAITALLASAAFIEAAQDATGAMVVDTTLEYVDATPSLRRAALSGDLVVPLASNVGTLATVNGNVGSWGLAASVGQFTVNAKGLITAAANVAIAIASAAITDSTAAGRAMLTAATVAAQTALLDVVGAAKGLMSAADKTKLDGIATGANLYVHPNHSGDVTSIADGAQTIANDAVNNAKLADMAANTIKGSVAGGDPADLTAAQVNTILSQPTRVPKTADEIVNNSTALQNDNHLFFAVLANTTYEFEIDLHYETNTAADFKATFTGPAAPTIVSLGWRSEVSTDLTGEHHNAFSLSFIVLHAVGTTGHIYCKGILQNGANAGTVQLQWAQNTAHASNTTVFKGSTLKHSVVA